MMKEQAEIYLAVTAIGVVMSAVAAIMAWRSAKKAEALWRRFLEEENLRTAMSYILLYQYNPQVFVQDKLAYVLCNWPDLRDDQRRKLRCILEIMVNKDVRALGIYDGREEYFPG